MSSLNLVQGNRTYTHSIQNDLYTSNVMINCDPRLKGPRGSILDVKSRAGKLGVEDDICDLTVANLTVTNLTVRGKITVDKIPLNLLDGGTNYSDYLFYDTATNCFQIGNNQVHLGAQATAIGTDAVAIGFNSDARGSGSIAIGDSSSVNINSLNGIAIGSDSTSGGSGSIAIGDTARAEGVGSIAIGKSTTTGGTNTVVLGDNTKIASNNCLILNSSGEAISDFNIPGFLVNGDFSVPLGTATTIPPQIQFLSNTSPLYRSTNGNCGGGPGVPPGATFLRFGANSGQTGAETIRTQALLEGPQSQGGAYVTGDKFIISFEYKWLNSTDGPCPGGNPSLWNIPPTPFFANPNMSDAWVPQLRIISGSTILARKLILDNPNSWTTEVLEYTIPNPAPPNIYFRFNKRGDLFQQNLVPPTNTTIWAIGNVRISKIKAEAEPNELVIKTQSTPNESIPVVPNATASATTIQKPGGLDSRFSHYLVCDPTTGEIRICSFTP